MWKLYRAHVLLLVCAYVGFLAYFAVTDPNNPVAGLFSARSEAGGAAAAAGAATGCDIESGGEQSRCHESSRADLGLRKTQRDSRSVCV